MKTFRTQSEARAYVENINIEKWGGALKRADVAAANDDVDGCEHWSRIAKAWLSEMNRVEALIPSLPA